MRNFILCGMQFGDEGKGTFVDYLAHKYNADFIVRYNGGSQASHTVVTPDGIVHKFSQLGSGMFNKNTKTYIGSNTVINFGNLYREVQAFNNVTGENVYKLFERIYISPDCLIVTPYHKLINILRELSQGNNRRGTVGTGVSEVAYLNMISKPYFQKGYNFNKYGRLAIKLEYLTDKSYYSKIYNTLSGLQCYARDYYLDHRDVITKSIPDDLRERIEIDISHLFDPNSFKGIAEGLIEKAELFFDTYKFFKTHIFNQPAYLNYLDIHTCSDYTSSISVNNFMKDFTIIYEGSQGLLLDRKYGIKPNTTMLDTTCHRAIAYTKDFERELRIRKNNAHITPNKIGIAKAFYTRHGMGVFPTESEELSNFISDENQEETYWNGKIRFGWFDAVLFRYAQSVNKVESVFLSSLDKLDGLELVKICDAYKYNGRIDDDFKSLFDFYYDSEDGAIIKNIKRASPKLKKYLSSCEPIYYNMPGWRSAITIDENDRIHLSKNCEEYILYLSSLINVPIKLISYGPTRNDKMFI